MPAQPHTVTFFSEHALERCAERNIPPEMAVHAVAAGDIIHTDRTTCTYLKGRLHVVVNSFDGTVVTVFRRHKSSIKRSLKKNRQATRKYHRKLRHEHQCF